MARSDGYDVHSWSDEELEQAGYDPDAMRASGEVVIDEVDLYKYER